MNLGDIARNRLLPLLLAAFVALFALPQTVAAQEQQAGANPPPTESSALAPAADAASVNAADPAVPAAQAAEGSTVEAAPGEEVYTPLAAPEWIRGQPASGAFDFQKQYTDDGEYALWMHTWILLPLITAISLLVLALLLYVGARYRRRRNPVPSKTSHNTVIEIIWTVVPVVILVAIAIPSITLLSRQYDSAPKDALTIKATGYQWYWGYTYADNGGFEVISNMLDEETAHARNEPSHLAADNRMVVPVGEPIRMQVTGADVIHSFGVPSLWFKIDAVPGRLNERVLTINEPGIYYGQCMELCGARHGYMPIVIEAVSRPQFEAWVRLQGGTVGGAQAAAAPASAAPLQEPESAVEGAPGAGAAPTGETAPAATAPAA